MDRDVDTSVSQGETSEKCNSIVATAMHRPELSEYLSSAYEVLRKVFSFLCLEDLENAAEAFESWKAVAEVTRKERSCIESFVVSDQKYNMSKIWSEAAFCICFCTAPNKELEEKIARYIAPDGEFLQCLSGAGVIGTLHDLSQIVQQKVRVGLSMSHKRFYFTTLRIPNVPKVGVKTYFWEEDMDFGEFKNNFDIPSDQIIKCLIILMIAEGSVQKANMQKNDFINFLQSRQKEPFAIGGSVVDSFGNYSDVNNSTSMIKYIVFYGDNVEAASTVLTADVKSLAGINSKIKRLKEMCPVTKKGALFVFRCAGRQRVIRRNKLGHTNITKWEGETIQKHFPNIPVIGCFGYGEFGRESPCDQDEFLPLKKLKLLKWEFSFSTSIVFIGFMK